ncbi:hypothetical protein, variant [Exophiala mesophila]|nr:hypothetical protein, variant [Exophiala mesophila]KIV90593.1 hypothetical protein, variant [Exophiala mesophila]
MAIRRNSPSFPQSKSQSKLLINETSPAASSPFSNSSPRLFWQGRDPNSPARESTLDPSPSSLNKRSSIENLKRASRVKNSSMFEIEQKNNYDPSRPTILDGRPQTMQPYSPRSHIRASDTLRKENIAPVAVKPPAQSPLRDVHDSDSNTVNGITPLSPSRLNSSPVKSSLSKKTGSNFRRSGFNPDTGIWEDDDDVKNKQLPPGRGLHRHNKSVTFDQAPPQVNEYEMTTPAPSSLGSESREGSYESVEDEDEDMSFERGSSIDHDDSFDASLEDTDKTPVVLPEDWRFMSPDTAKNELTRAEDDVFNDDCGSPEPTATPGAFPYRPHQTSAGSVDSNGQTRPLPPLPAGVKPSSNSLLSGAFERMSIGQRSLPTPPMAAAISKIDILKIGNSTSLSPEDRLRLMALQEEERERRMRRLGSKDSSPVREPSVEGSVINHGEPGPEIYTPRATTPKLSRESVLQGLRADANQDSRESSAETEISHAQSSSVYDPDVPIPSTEDQTDERHQPVFIKQEEYEEDLYSIPDLYARGDVSESEQGGNLDDDLTSQYSQASTAPLPLPDLNDDGQNTPKAQSPIRETPKVKSATGDRVSLPEFNDFGKDTGFDIGLSPFLTQNEEKPMPDLAALRQTIQRSYSPEVQTKGQQSLATQRFQQQSYTVAEPKTFRAQAGTDFGRSHDRAPLVEQSRFDTDSDRSMSPSESGSVIVNPKEGSPISPMSAEFPDDLGTMEKETKKEGLAGETTTLRLPLMTDSKRVSSLVPLEISQGDLEDGLGLGPGLEQAFDRVVEAQKRGYLMRQNTKIVVASERLSNEESRSPGLPAVEGDLNDTQALQANQVTPSPRKTSQPTWTAEPWNGKVRRKSIRVGGEKAVGHRKAVGGPVPPLPGQASNAQEALDAVAEDEVGEEDEWEDGAERGRLFVKVVGVKDLQMPFPQHERTHFALTLDNGLHCVTTAWLDLARSAPIGQEFELVVLNDLEFQLTLQMKLEEPRVERPQSPSKAPNSPKKPGAFGRLFGSPKKKKEMELRAQQEAQATRRPVTPPSAYELVQGLVAKDGSFARAYVTLSEHEKEAYGRPYTVDITCFNEWALEEVVVGSSRSKKGVTQLQRRPPYEIGKLEVQLLYVPKPKGAKDEDMPKSMNGAIRALREAEQRVQQQANIQPFEGYLSQQGGDCPYWRRRFFKLSGTKLTAFHETTLQPRATINIAKATRLIDDKSALMQRETSTKGGGRRKSGFAEEEEGYMFVEEGFRIRFANGEVIDFYADATADKDQWMQALSQVVGKGVQASNAPNRGWIDMVLKREKKLQGEMTQGPRAKGHQRTETYHTSSGLTQHSPSKNRVAMEERHRKTKSMVG